MHIRQATVVWHRSCDNIQFGVLHTRYGVTAYLYLCGHVVKIDVSPNLKKDGCYTNVGGIDRKSNI
jgi:hypothetical protein